MDNFALDVMRVKTFQWLKILARRYFKVSSHSVYIRCDCLIIPEGIQNRLHPASGNKSTRPEQGLRNSCSRHLMQTTVQLKVAELIGFLCTEEELYCLTRNVSFFKYIYRNFLCFIIILLYKLSYSRYSFLCRLT